MEYLNESDVKLCIYRAVPEIAEYLIEKMNKNVGFEDHPACISPLTQLLTLSLDQKTRAAIEGELMVYCNHSFEETSKKIRFIRACCDTICLNDVENEFVWMTLDDACSRDGCLFIQKVSEMIDSEEKTNCENFIQQWSSYK